jgi:hypothetical protein
MPRLTQDSVQSTGAGQMEALWEDLSRTPEAIASPGWHKDVLENRQKRVAEGKVRYADWETAKTKIRHKVS